MQLDELDHAILQVLSEDARATYSEISKLVGVSVGTVRNRIVAMRESGSYYGATAHGEVRDVDRAQARALGRRVAEVALRLRGGPPAPSGTA